MVHLAANQDKERPEQDEEWGEETWEASMQQEEIGENTFMEGLLARKWEWAQAAYVLTIESKQNPSRWVTELIRKLWNVSWDMWDSWNREVHKNKYTQRKQIIKKLDEDKKGITPRGKKLCIRTNYVVFYQIF